MNWPPQNTGLFEHKKECCTCNSCPGALLIPPRNTSLGFEFFDDTTFAYWVLSVGKFDHNTFFADLATATAAVSNNVQSCLTFSEPVSGDYPNTYLYSASQVVGTSITITHDFGFSDDNGAFMTSQCSINLPAGSLFVDWTMSQVEGELGLWLFDCDGVLVEHIEVGDTSLGSGTEEFVLPAAGEYIFAAVSHGGRFNSFTSSFVLSGSTSIAANNVVAIYDDGTVQTAELPCA